MKFRCNNIIFEKLLRDLVELPAETETVEFKVDNFASAEIGKRISGLANSANLYDRKCSYMVFGVEDKTHELVGTNFSPTTAIVGAEGLHIWLAKHLDPKIDFRIDEAQIDGVHIVLFTIPPAISHPVRFDNTAYIRIGSATPKLSDYPEKESEIWANINRKSFEKGIAKEHLVPSDILKLLDYEKYFATTNQEIPSTTDTFVERMEQHGLVKKVFEKYYDITNLGAILYAKDLNDFPTVRRKAVRVVMYADNTRVNILKEREGRYGYAVSFETLLEYINDKLPSNEEISHALRKEVRMYPEVAVREFVANALIHRDLSLSGAGPLIEIFQDRIEITNTGEPLIDTDRFIDHPPRSRNEDLASFMRQIRICEEGVTGIDRALVNVALYQLPAPKFERYDNFTKVTMYARRALRDMTLDDKVRACFQHCVLKNIEGKRMTNESLRERLGIASSNYPAASSIIKATIEQGYIKESERPREYVPVWAQGIGCSKQMFKTVISAKSTYFKPNNHVVGM